MKTKTCAICKIEKDISEFGKHDRFGHLNNKCKPCFAESMKEYRNTHPEKTKESRKKCYLKTINKRKQYNKKKLIERKQLIYNILIISGGCIDCGLKDPECLEFDHKDRDDKIMNIARAKQSSSTEKLLKEIDKCEIRCANCHRIKHAEELGYYKHIKD